MEELNQLHGLVAATDAEAAPTPPEGMPPGPDGQPVAITNYQTEAEGAVDMFAALVVGYCPSCENLWEQGTKARISAALAPVLEKYGVSMGNLPPELLLLVTAGPVLWNSSRLMAQQINEAKDKASEQAKTEPLPGPQQSNGLETPESAIHPQMALYKQ